MTNHRPNETRITIRFPSEVIDEMRVAARADDRSVNAEIIRALREFLLRRAQEANQATAKTAC